jgi:hypothetical protein
MEYRLTLFCHSKNTPKFVGSGFMATPQLVTAREAAHVLSKLSGRTCSPARVRRLLVKARLGTELQARQKGQTRLFGAFDLVIVRVALELERQGISAWVSKVVLTYLRDDLVRAFKSAAPVALAVTGLRGSLEPSLKARPSSAIAWVPLREAWKGLEPEIETVRGAKPTIWMWTEVPCHAVKRSTSGHVA